MQIYILQDKLGNLVLVSLLSQCFESAVTFCGRSTQLGSLQRVLYKCFYPKNIKKKECNIQEHRITGASLGFGCLSDFFLEVTVTLTFNLVTQKWVWRVEVIKVHLHMKFQSCRWKHFDFRAYVKV
jgi:hypothetical protein